MKDLMLIGQYQGSLGEKNRVAVPNSFRKELGKKVIVAKWYEGCLVLVGEQRWQALLKGLTGERRLITAPVRDTDRFILGSAFELSLDAQGRGVIPTILVEYAGLGKEIMFLGLRDRVEIWNKEAWLKQEVYVAKNAAQFIEKLADGNS